MSVELMISTGRLSEVRWAYMKRKMRLLTSDVGSFAVALTSVIEDVKSAIPPVSRTNALYAESMYSHTSMSFQR